jgi:hypothetical protein
MAAKNQNPAFKAGEKPRLRIINGLASSLKFYDLCG